MVQQATRETSPATTPRIESLLSNRLFVAPRLVGDRLYFISNLAGHFSLYAMDRGGSVPEPLLPPDIALQNPELVGGYSFYVFPGLGKILVMIDRDGDENYQPMVVPIEGGIPQPAFGNELIGYRVHLGYADADSNRVGFNAESRVEPLQVAFLANLETGELRKLAEGKYGPYISGANDDRTRVTLVDGYSFGDTVLYLWEEGADERRLLYGTPIEQRSPGQDVPLTAFAGCFFTPGDRGLLCYTGLFSDAYGLGYIDLASASEVKPVTITGTVHTGVGELEGLDDLDGTDDRYRVTYNIDGASWMYEGTFDEDALELRLERCLVGQGELASGTLEAATYDKESDSYAISFSTATSPTQLYVLDGPERTPRAQTRERVLGIPQEWLSPGEDASFTSFDGLRISARLYLPSPELGYQEPYPLVYYIHGGPQSQERPNFAWFSMPLIQFLTLRGFAVFVPNVRGSTGYGLAYMKHVDNDWGGKDRLDHVYAMEHVLPADGRLDVQRAGVMGRSYGGYMTLTLASRHPQIWKAAIDMFGPYNLVTFVDRIPETWKTYFHMVVGNPETDREALLERSPVTYIDDVTCPLFVIQGRNDPRVVEQESRDVVEGLRARGKETDILVFENEGHDVLKFENRVRCYNAITEYFERHLKR